VNNTALAFGFLRAIEYNHEQGPQ
jgi:hypothetical protein